MLEPDSRGLVPAIPPVPQPFTVQKQIRPYAQYLKPSNLAVARISETSPGMTPLARSGVILSATRYQANLMAATPARMSAVAPARAGLNGSPSRNTPMTAANTTEHSRSAATAPMSACVIAQTTSA